jgi:hypothetical protein
MRQHPLEKAGDVLVLAGDIGYLGDDNYSTHPFWDFVATSTSRFWWFREIMSSISSTTSPPCRMEKSWKSGPM